MNSTVVMNPAVQGLLPGMGKNSKMGIGAENVFAMLLGQMIGDEQQMFDAVFANMQDLQQDLEEQGIELSMEMLSGLFMPPTLANDLNALSSSEQLGELSRFVQAAQGNISGAEAKVLTQAENPGDGMKFTIKQVSQDLTESMTSSEKTPIAPSNLISGQAQFRNSVLEAQKLLKSVKNDKEQPETIDVDALQQQVNQGRFNTNYISKADPQPIKPEEIITQLKTGISSNLSKGKNEFVVKLKPEGLGEITVKMVENNSKISLSIITSSTNVARLLNGEIEALKQSLRPLNVEVFEVTANNAGSQANAHDSFFGQAFAGQHHNSGFSGHGQKFSYSGEEFIPEAEMEEAAYRPLSELDAYI